MEYKNHKITEAICAFRFSPDHSEWDILNLANYYKLIEPLGFEKKQEVKPFQVSFNIKANEVIPAPKMEEGETKMVFRNKEENRAILMGKNFISFHSINYYPGWDVFLPELIKPYLEEYFKLDVSKDIVSVQMLYINNFEINKEENLSDYLSVVPNMKELGEETNELGHVFQSSFKIEPNLQLNLQTVLNVVPQNNTKKITLECNCIASNNIEHKYTWDMLANDAHEKAKKAFLTISTDKFKHKIQ
jgi:uncharacterized protein (TIGR04255 family)